MKVCKYCGTELKNTVSKCTTCGSSDLLRKCDNCGTQFMGNFCPTCGLNADQSLKTCPECKTKYYTNACPNCGYISSQKKTVSKGSLLKIILPITLVTIIAIVILAILMTNKVTSIVIDTPSSTEAIITQSTDMQTEEPTAAPTEKPTATSTVTELPTEEPTVAPTEEPAAVSTEAPETIPTAETATVLTGRQLSDEDIQKLYGKDPYTIQKSISTIEDAVAWLNLAPHPYADFSGHDVSGYPGIAISQNSYYLIKNNLFAANQMTQMAAWLLVDDIPDISVIIRLPCLDYGWNELLCVPKDGGYDLYDIVKSVPKTVNKANPDTKEFTHINDLSEVADLYYDRTSEIAQYTDFDYWIAVWRNPQDHDREVIFVNRSQLNIIKSAPESVLEKCPEEKGREAMIELSQLLGVEIKIP